jgi:hypothetical protein
MLKNFFLCALLVLASSFPAAAAQTLKVPNGNPVMVDGRCDPDEWKDAAKLPGTENYRLLFKKNQDYVYICIDSLKPSNFMMDLYFAPDAKRAYTLHASAKLGEMSMEGGKWKEFTTDYDWWNVQGWTANTARLNSPKEPRFLPNRAIEYQISRKHFGGSEWRVMFDFLNVQKPLMVPADADKLLTDTWIRLKL